MNASSSPAPAPALSGHDSNGDVEQLGLENATSDKSSFRDDSQSATNGDDSSEGNNTNHKQNDDRNSSSGINAEDDNDDNDNDDDDDDMAFAAHAAAQAMSENDDGGVRVAAENVSQQVAHLEGNTATAEDVATISDLFSSEGGGGAGGGAAAGAAAGEQSQTNNYQSQPQHLYQSYAPELNQSQQQQQLQPTSSYPPPPPPPPLQDEGPLVCCICNRNEEEDSRPILRFLPVQHDMAAASAAPTVQTFHQDISLHIFCGKTASILPTVNRPDLEILTKAGLKNKHGIGPEVNAALARTRCAILAQEGVKEKHFFLVREFEAHLAAIRHTHITFPQMIGAGGTPPGLAPGIGPPPDATTNGPYGQLPPPTNFQYGMPPLPPPNFAQSGQSFQQQQQQQQLIYDTNQLYNSNVNTTTNHNNQSLLAPMPPPQAVPSNSNKELPHKAAAGHIRKSSTRQQQQQQQLQYAPHPGGSMAYANLIDTNNLVNYALTQNNDDNDMENNDNNNNINTAGGSDFNNNANNGNNNNDNGTDSLVPYGSEITADGRVQCPCGGVHGKGVQSWKKHVTTKKHKAWMEENGTLGAV